MITCILLLLSFLFIVATFDVIYWIGWKPHKSQPQPLHRGSGQTSLVESLSEGLETMVEHTQAEETPSSSPSKEP